MTDPVDPLDRLSDTPVPPLADAAVVRSRGEQRRRRARVALTGLGAAVLLSGGGLAYGLSGGGGPDTLTPAAAPTSTPTASGYWCAGSPYQPSMTDCMTRFESGGSTCNTIEHPIRTGEMHQGGISCATPLPTPAPSTSSGPSPSIAPAPPEPTATPTRRPDPTPMLAAPVEVTSPDQGGDYWAVVLGLASRSDVPAEGYVGTTGDVDCFPGAEGASGAQPGDLIELLLFSTEVDAQAYVERAGASPDAVRAVQTFCQD